MPKYDDWLDLPYHQRCASEDRMERLVEQELANWWDQIVEELGEGPAPSYDQMYEAAQERVARRLGAP